MDLATDYMGLALRNPLVASASPLARTVDGVRRLADAGVGAIVLPSLFEEELRAEALLAAQPAGPGGVAGGPAATVPGHYLDLIEHAAAAVDVPVIASLNGITTGGWTDYASAMQAAGAAAIELNIYYLPADTLLPGREVEHRVVEILTTVKAVVTIPVAVKLGPYFSSTGEIALRLDHAGADGLVLFNRFMQLGIDTETLTVSSELQLSTRVEANLPRAWIALLRGRIGAALAASTGVEDATDVAGYLLAGADVVMTTSALLRHGPGYAAVLLDGLTAWMKRKDFAAVSELRGRLAAAEGPSKAAYGRAGYLSAIEAATRTHGH
jgi:dihydroorotate dehydrogenase (fumarate)